MTQQQLLSRKATRDSHGQGSSYFLGWQKYEENPYDPVKNPTGIIQMGLAENQLSFDLLEAWISENPETVGLKRKGASVFRELALFQDYHGLPAFKSALAEFMADIRGNRVKFDPKKLVLTAGSTSANETLIFCLAEPGDAVLVPTPYYPGFDRDLKWRTGVEIVPIHCSSSNGFRITEMALEAAFKDAHQRKLIVRGVLVTNPSNPLGTSMTSIELKKLLSFVTTKNIHLVCDEIYSGTVFSSPDFISIAEALDDETRQRVHIVYSLSKDLGLPGFRVGAIYSDNETVVATATKMSSFGLVSSQTQYLLSALLSDKKFTLNYIAENQRRLKQRHQLMVSGLQQAGITCLKSNAGLFCWVDMRHLLSTPTLDGEMELWKKMLYQVGLNISPGSSCHCTEPGWFRVCFSNMSEKTLNVSMKRMKMFVDAVTMQSRRKVTITSKKGPFSPKLSLKKWVLRLSSSDKEPER